MCFNIFCNSFILFSFFFDKNFLIFFWIILMLLSYFGFPSFHFSRANLSKSLSLFLSLFLNILINFLLLSILVFIYLLTLPTSSLSVIFLSMVFLYNFIIKLVNFFWSSNFFLCFLSNIFLQKFWIILALSLSV